MVSTIENYRWLDVRFTPKVEKALNAYLKEQSNPEITVNDFEHDVITDDEREDYIRYTLAWLQAFWINPPGKGLKPKAKTPEEIEDFQIETIYELNDGDICQLEGMGL